MISTDNHRTTRRGTRVAALLAPIGVAMAVLAAAAIHLATSPNVPVGQALAQVAPTPSPAPSSQPAIMEMGLWGLGGLVLATVLAFAIIARLSRHSAGDDR